MKILIATTDCLEENTAGANFILSISHALTQIGIHVTVLHRGIGPGKRTGDKKYSGIRFLGVRWVPIRGWGRVFPFFFARALKRLVEAVPCEFDWMLIRIIPDKSILRVIERCQIPMIANHMEESYSNPSVRGAARNIMLLLHNYKKELVAQCAVGFNLPEERFVHCYYNAVDPTLFPDPGQSSPLRDKHRLSRQAFIMVHVSTFRKHHDFDTLLRAASTLDFPYEILFVGTGGRVSEVKEKARALGVTARFLGSRTLAEIAELQMASDVCVDPLLPFYVAEDNLRPAKLWEYVASGRPVVETIDPGLPVADWAREWLALVPPADTAALADALRDIRSRPDIWAQKGMRAREWVLANHTWKHVAEEVVSAVQLAMEKRRGN